MTARSDPTALRKTGALVLIVAVAASALSAGVAAGANVTDADRTIEGTELEPGESTTVTVEAALNEPGDPAIYEEFDPAFERVEIASTDPDIDAVNDGNGELVAIWEETDAAILEYEVTVPDDAETGDAFTITGEAEAADGTMVIEGDTEIDVVTDEFEVSIAEANDSVEQGESLVVNATVENTGDLEGTQNVEFLFDGTVVSNESVPLGAGNDTTVTFTRDTGDDEPGEYDIEVRSDDDSDERTVTVTEPESDGSDGSDDSDSGLPSSPDDAFFDVTIADADESVTQGESLVVNATVENTGDETGTQDLEFLFDGTVEAVEEDVTLDGGEAKSLTFTADATAELGEYEVAVKSDDDGATTTVKITESKTKTDGTDDESDGETGADGTDDETDDSDAGTGETPSDDENGVSDDSSVRPGESGEEADDATPGFGPAAVVVGVALALLVGLRRTDE